MGYVAVFVYQMDSHHYWQRELKRADWTFGQFGENFTVEGLADSEVYIGDRYRIGGNVFEVTQPRVTCERVGIRIARDGASGENEHFKAVSTTNHTNLTNGRPDQTISVISWS